MTALESERSVKASPRPALSVGSAAAIIVGIVIGGGIFKLPAYVAANVAGPWTLMACWLGGGLVCLIGALCYAELACAYPDAGGDYHWIRKAFGEDVAFLFAWARLMVIQTGSIALQAFIFGDYATKIFSLGEHSSSIYAAAVVAIFTAMNLGGVRLGSWTQNLLSAAVVLGLGAIVIAAAVKLGGSGAAPVAASGSSTIGMAMVLVLITFGGWNEAAYLSAEMRDGRRAILSALLLGIGIITAVYLLVNGAMLLVLGVGGMAGRDAVAADMMSRVAGPWGAKLLSACVIVAVLSTINGTIFTGARTIYAMGRDFSALRFLGRWNPRASQPEAALLTQGIIALALVAFGLIARGKFETMVEYTTPVFWTFLLLGALSLLVLRTNDADRPRPFRVPLYPVLPLIFVAVCIYMLYSGLNYTGTGALFGVGVLLVGIPVLMLGRLVGNGKNN